MYLAVSELLAASLIMEVNAILFVVLTTLKQITLLTDFIETTLYQIFQSNRPIVAKFIKHVSRL